MRERSFLWNVRLLPISIALIAVSWIFLLHIYLPPESTWVPWALISLAFILLVFRVMVGNKEPWTERLSLPRWVGVLGILSCITVFIIFPYPYTIGVMPLGIGWIVMVFTRRHSLGRFIATALVQIGLLLMISAACLPFLFAWAARIHELAGLAYFLTPLSTWILELLGQSTNQISADLHLRTFEDLFQQTITSEKLLPVPLLLFTLIWTIFIILRNERKRIEKVMYFWIGATAYSVIRIIILLLIMVQRVSPTYFWEPTAMVLSVVPLALFLREPKEISATKRPRALIKGAKLPEKSSLILGGILGVAAVIALTFKDPGQSNVGRILINEHGSDWEWTTEPLDTVQYNEKTTYNYYCMAEFLKYYYQVETNIEPLTPERLQDVDVLILKTPTQAYEESEIESIVQFVRRGGGLWIIGDHTNVFGSSSFSNPLLRHFGFRLNYDSTHDLRTGKLSLYRKPPMFAHPSIQNLPPYLFATSCSIMAPWSAENTIIGNGLRADYLDYSQKNFFPDRTRKQFNHGFGLFMQQATAYHGKGRVLIYTDSTTFSNFFIFIKGKPELVLGSVDWLNRSNHLLWVKTVLTILTIMAAIFLIVLNAWNSATLCGILIGVSLGGWLIESQTQAAYPLPEPHQSVPWVNFDREYSDYFLPTLRLSEDNDKSFLTFFVWTQRVGAIPKEVYNFREAVNGRDPLVMIDPVIPLSEEESGALQRYLLRGGRLLLLNSADNVSTAPMKLLDNYGVNFFIKNIEPESIQSLTLAGRFFPLIVDGKFAIVEGGEPFLRSDQGEVIGTSVPVGEGKIWVLSCGHLFRNSGMGQTSVVPDEGLKALYRIEFNLINDLIYQPPEEGGNWQNQNDKDLSKNQTDLSDLK